MNPGPDERPSPGPTRQKTGVLVADRLRRRITSGEFGPGDRLPTEDELMAEHGLAHTTIREGLRILEDQGLVEVRRGRFGGGWVTRPDAAQVARPVATSLQLDQVTYRDVHDATEVLEPVLAGRLAGRATREDITALLAACDRAALAARSGDAMAFGGAAASFHEEVVARSGNRTLATFAGILAELRRGYYQWASHQAGDRRAFERVVRSYRKLVRLVESGDVAGAEAHWRRLLADVARSAGSRLDAPVSFP